MNNISISFNAFGVTYNRQISVSLSASGATGNVFDNDTKTGFYRWNKGYKYPMFFSSKGKQIKGSAPINTAIAEAVKKYCDELRAKNSAKPKPEIKVNTPAGQATVTPYVDPDVPYSSDDEPELSGEEIIKMYMEEEEY